MIHVRISVYTMEMFSIKNPILLKVLKLSRDIESNDSICPMNISFFLNKKEEYEYGNICI